MIMSLLLKSLGSLTVRMSIMASTYTKDRLMVGLGIFGPVQLGQNVVTLGICFYAAT